MSEKDKGQNIEYQESYLFRLTRRMVLFLASLFTAMFCFYLTGNYQSFMDSTLRLIMVISSVILIFQSAFSLLGMILSIFTFSRLKRKRYWVSFSLFLLSFIVSPVVLVLLNVFSILSTGI